MSAPGVDDVRAFCQRVRSAGSPNARARASLVTDYRRMATALGVAPAEVERGLDLQRAAASLLRVAADAEVAAAATPAARLRRVGRPT